jgi:outer membrane protein OmpA-like peptidoglycan-associated protein
MRAKWRNAAAGLLSLLLGTGSVCAQDLSGQIVALTYPADNLVYPVKDLAYRVEDLGAQVKKLAVKETATETRIELPADILFDFDNSAIRPTAAEALQQVAAILRERARGTVRIEGHTDSKGTPAYNQKLSERRADSVRLWLVEREGLVKVKFTTQGLAATRPAVSNTKPDGSDDPEGRQKNRRVEIVFGKTKK